MARDRTPKHKLSRREGVDLFRTGSPSLQRRLDQPPGQHGRAGRPNRRQSEYSKQLREKQKVKRMYGVHEMQFHRIYLLALRSRGITGLAFLKLLERRLDNVVYRAGLARTRPQARQFVSHGLVYVDGRRINIPSYLVKPGQTISLKPHAMEIPDVKETQESNLAIPNWLAREDGGFRIVREPERNEIDQDINERLIVEYYSR